MQLLIYFIVSFINVFIHVLKTIMIVKSTRLTASLANGFCYTFSAVVIKFIAEFDLTTAIVVQAITNFTGCYIAMWVHEIIEKKRRKEKISYGMQGKTQS